MADEKFDRWESEPDVSGDKGLAAPKPDIYTVEVSRKKSRPRVAPQYIPPSQRITTDEEGNTTITPTAPAVARNVEHLKTLKAPMISQGAGRKMEDKTGVVRCDYSDSPDVHSGPATHFLRLPGVSRAGVEAVCQKHLRMAQEKAAVTGDQLHISSINPRNAEGFKILRRIQEQEKLAGVQIALMSKGMTGENAQYGPASYRSTSGYSEEDKARASLPFVFKTKLTAENIDPNWDPTQEPPKGKSVKYDLPKKTIKVQKGKKEPEPYVSPELSEEELSRLDAGTRAMVQGRRARGVPPQGYKQYSSKNIGVMPMAIVEPQEAVSSAFGRIAEEQAPAVEAKLAVERQALKQRRSEAARRDPEFRAALEQHLQQRKPKELE